MTDMKLTADKVMKEFYRSFKKEKDAHVFASRFN